MTHERTSHTATSDATGDTVVARVVVLGASNVARGLASIVDTARAVIGGPCEMMIACGHGRSYGVHSYFGPRRIGGIVDSMLWDELERSAAKRPLPTYAFITDIGNDVVYRQTVADITAWVDTCLDRLQRHDARIVMTGLPIASLRRLSPVWFHVARLLLFPRAGIGLDYVIDTSEQLDAAVRDLANQRGVTLCDPLLEWYGVDPIHVRMRHWPEAYTGFLRHWFDPNDPRRDTRPVPTAPYWRTFRYLQHVPAQRWVFGIEQRGKQPAIRLNDGTTIGLY